MRSGWGAGEREERRDEKERQGPRRARRQRPLQLEPGWVAEMVKAGRVLSVESPKQVESSALKAHSPCLPDPRTRSYFPQE